MMDLFVDTVGSTTPLTGFDETGITYLVATNAGWLRMKALGSFIILLTE